jgi:microcystin-dependent protein
MQVPEGEISLYTYGQKWGVVAANLVRKLWASDTPPDSPVTGEIYLDKSGSPPLLKRYKGATWDTVGAVATKCTGAEINTGTDDAKFATPKAIGDSYLGLVGVVLPYAGASAPTGFLLCDGAAVSRTTYARLFTVIGTAFGVGDGTTTFNIPDMKGRAPFGFDSADASFDAIGHTGGAKTADISHGHSVDPPNTPSAAAGGTDEYYAFGTLNGAWLKHIKNHNHNVDIAAFNSATGGSTTSPILPPFLTYNFIIKT